MTGPANSHATAFMNIGIPFCKFVIAFAMGLACALREGALTANNHIDVMCDGFKMFGIYATSIAAFVVQFKPFRYGANEKFISDYMCPFVFSFPNQMAVTLTSIGTSKSAGPIPTGFCLLNFRPKSNFGFFWRIRPVTNMASVFCFQNY